MLNFILFYFFKTFIKSVNLKKNMKKQVRVVLLTTVVLLLSLSLVYALWPFTGRAIDTSSGLVAYYKLDGNANDASGNGNDGKLVGGVSFVEGKVDKAANFDGVDSRIETKTLANRLTGGQITLSSWVY